MKVTTANSCLAGDDDKWPPGFRFHPTDEELVLYYLKRKICRRRLRLDIIRVLDVYKSDPEDLPGQSILKTGDRQWFFFTPRDRKYPNGGRSNRATRHGYWKATGKDRNITCNSRTVGIKKTLVFYRGRAPHGERTDWVMHEYTLDEDELKRCLNAQEYYALYKVYKKSGPGPKNGEQYGAPFNEEEWADDEFGGVVSSVALLKQQNSVAPPPDNTKALAQEEQPLTVEDFMKQLDGSFELPEIADYSNGLQQVASEGETQSILIDPSSREVIFPAPVSTFPTSNQQCEEVSFDFNQSATSKTQILDAAEVTSVPTGFGGPLICDDDFLEMDDLLGPEPTTLTNPKQPVENLGFDDINGLSEFELYQDAASFWNDLGPVGHETVSHVSSVDSSVNQLGNQLHSHSAVNSVDHLQFQPQLTASDVNYLQSQEFGTDNLWESYLENDAFGSSTKSPQDPTPGVVHESSNNLVGGNPNQNGEENGGWFSSALWSFVESIPTTPASAAESPLVNKAFERMSSFSRLRMNVKNCNINPETPKSRTPCVSEKNTGGSRGIFLLSVIGVACAALWVVVGTT